AAGGKHAQFVVAAQARWAYPQARWFAVGRQGFMEDKQQPDMADLFQPGQRQRVVKGELQFNNATRRWRQVRLAGNGKFFSEWSEGNSDRGNVHKKAGNAESASIAW